MPTEGLDLLKHWEPIIQKAIKEIFIEYQSDKNLFLSEADITCVLFNALRKMSENSKRFAVHSQVTHNADFDEKKATWRFRDLVVMNPKKLYNNTEVDDLDDIIVRTKVEQKSKGWRHVGESIFFEIKFQRHANNRIDNEDIADLQTYLPTNNRGYEKFAFFIWGTKFQIGNEKGNLIEQMESALNTYKKYKLQNTTRGIELENVYGVIISREKLVRFHFQGYDLKQY